MRLERAGADDTFTVTLLPPSDGGFQSVAVAQHSQQCLDDTNPSTADGAPVIQWTCAGGSTNQRFTLRKVTYAGNDSHDYRLVARRSGKCVDVSTVSTAPQAPIHRWTCNPAGQGGPLNQTWRLWGR